MHVLKYIYIMDMHTVESFLFMLGSMFMVSQNFPRSWGCNFVGIVIRVILINIEQLIVYRVVGV